MQMSLQIAEPLRDETNVNLPVHQGRHLLDQRQTVKDQVDVGEMFWYRWS